MSATAKAIKLIKKWEGCRLVAYPDPATGGAPWTIGYGATGPGIKRDVTWTKAQADARLADDVERFMLGVRKMLKQPATDTQLAAMISLAYNIGLVNFSTSTLRRKFNAGDMCGAAAQFTVWNKAGKPLRVMPGLDNRRADERRVFES